MIPRDLIFSFPWLGWLAVLIIPIVVLFWQLFLYRESALKAFFQPSLRHLLHPRSQRYYWLQCAAYCFAWLLLVQALMDPKGHGRYPEELLKKENVPPNSQEIRRKSHEVIFLLDTSSSMAVVDTRVGESRLDYGKEIIDELVSQLDGEEVSLYSLTSEMTLLVPSTNDYLYLRLMLHQIGYNEGDVYGTDFLSVLKAFQKQVLEQVSPRKLKTLILLSDGGDTSLEGLGSGASSRRIAEIAKTISDSEKLNLRVITIGLGGKAPVEIPNVAFEGHPVKSMLEEPLLNELSHTGRGQSYNANDYTSLSLARAIIEKMKQDNPYVDLISEKAEQPQAEMIYDHYFQLPLALAMLFLWGAIRMPQVARQHWLEEQ